MLRAFRMIGKGKEHRRIAATPARSPVPGFTLIELLVVVAIIGLLLSVLLPSLSRAREQAKAAKCAANLNAVGKAMHLYLAENRSTFPLSYAYPYNNSGDVDLKKQPPNREFGYVHWSWFLFDRGKVDDGSFSCPSVPNKGHPRTYPGSDRDHWELEQVDFAGNPPPNGLGDPRVEDRQASRMAYTANAAIVPRNKGKELGNIDVGLPRSNRFVRESEIELSGRTILATEFNRNWTVISVGGSGGWVSRSHRPVSPLYHEEGEYLETRGQVYPFPSFRYFKNPNDKNYGIEPLSVVEDAGLGRADEAGYNPMNFIGRHHPGGDRLGGTANFLFVDGHVTRTTVLKTVQDRMWGKKYYGVTGRDTEVAFYEKLP